jgi:O-antigen ligase
VAAALLALEAAGYDGRLFGPYFAPRYAPFYPLVFVLLALAVALIRPGRRPIRLDLVDLVGCALGVWIAVTAIASPAPWVAWLGYYNRGAGAVFDLSVIALFLVARRVLCGERERRGLVWTVALVLSLAAAIALVQAAGGSFLWTVVKPWPGRMTGTTGNPITLAGLSLLAVWLGAWLVSPGGPGRGRGRALRARRAVAWAGVAAGVVANALAVTRASYAGAAAGLVVLAVVAWHARRRRTLAAIGVAAVALCASALVTVPGGHNDSRSLSTRIGQSQAAGGGLNKNDAKRLGLWREALDGFKARPLLGYGAGAFVVVDRRHQASSRRFKVTGRIASDPHSLPLLVAATMGWPGLLLATSFGLLIALALARAAWREARAPPEQRAEDELPGGGRASALPALAFLAAAGGYLLVSPLDPAIAVPVALLGGAGLAVPARWPIAWSVTVPALREWRWGRVVAAAAVAALAAAAAATAVMGVRYYRADLAFAAYAKTGSTAAAASAANLFPWEPFYLLEAGAQTWREALSAGDLPGVAAGERLVRSGIARDPTGPLGYADLARLDVGTQDFARVPADLRPGLRANPHDPTMEGLWAYVALDILNKRKDPKLAASVMAALQATHPGSPDAWYWTAAYEKQAGDAVAAQAALARARRSAPRLRAQDYQRRLQRSR